MDQDPSQKESILKRLRESGRVELAAILETHWETSIEEYAQSLWDHDKKDIELEPELLQAFHQEFLRIGFSHEEASESISSLKRTRTLQTATHVTASEGPTFFASHQLALRGIPKGETYLVGAYSGVPFANAAWSGCLNFSSEIELGAILSEQAPGFSDLLRADQDRRRDTNERRISMIPGKWRDSQVFGSDISEKQKSLASHWNKDLQKLMPPTENCHSFSAWCSGFCRNQAEILFPKTKMIYFDLNEVIRNYLIKVISRPQHPMTMVLLKPEKRSQALDFFGPETSFFSFNTNLGNRIRLKSVNFQENSLKETQGNFEMNEEKLLQMLKERTFCPTLFICFTVLVFLNGLNCMGSFEQVEYLKKFKINWNHLAFPGILPEHLQETKKLSCGRMISIEGNPIYPLDLILGTNPSFVEPPCLGRWLEPLFPRLGLI